MSKKWNAFIQDYGQHLADWSIRELLEAFWRYCNDDDKAWDEFLDKGIYKKVKTKKDMGSPR